MITRSSRCSSDVLSRVADFAYANVEYMRANFSSSKTPADIGRILAASDSWYVLSLSEPLALFKLSLSETTATISDLCLNRETSVDGVIECLRQDLRKQKVTDMSIGALEGDVNSLGKEGCEKRDAWCRFSAPPKETQMMPLLPLMNPTQTQLPILSNLMHESYSKTGYRVCDVQSAENELRKIMSGESGKYLSDASFASGVIPNIVSACLINLDSAGEAVISQLFTHPLYRARGLATTEIAAAMNRLHKTGVPRLHLWGMASDDVVRRLVEKLGFQADRRVVEMWGSV